MPEMPEVQGLVDFLAARTSGLRVSVARLASIQALKTFDPPLEDLLGATVTRAARHGKWLDLVAQPMSGDGAVHLVFHLARAGWLRWYEELPKTQLRPGRSPIALRIGFEDGSGFDLTEAGTKKKLAAYLVTDPEQVPMLSTLGPDPLAETFTVATLAQILSARRTQLKGVLRDQSVIAGIGNAYSDEILHAARMSPFTISATLDEGAVQVLHEAITTVLRRAVEEASGRPAAELKDAKRSGMAVHGRTGQQCPVCADTVAEVSFADSSLQYCPTCQTGGKVLADRRMSRLLR
ncbi:MAG TPA: Fpg/Nei family DNA glycosylase [Candidatus Ruania gallistercoris]|uniref:Fpg/Nei family DNA glycosylase n=1 Tax=Candidatus Ruania gallistercoris TaxID=2838746 RepID=A0A9D2EGW2_9MICO|nr:Fpg/Nei family DNA glycosylase [Candidatus Ruania gallistercoris]